MFKKVCIDTNILSWFIKSSRANPNEEEKAIKARALFPFLEKHKSIIFIPSIVVAEIINDVTDRDEKQQIIDIIAESFEIGAFDAICALDYTELFQKYKDSSKNYRENNNLPKWKMQNDWLIATEAKAYNCSCIITNNKKDFQHFIGDYLPILDLDEATNGIQIVIESNGEGF